MKESRGTRNVEDLTLDSSLKSLQRIRVFLLPCKKEKKKKTQIIMKRRSN